MTTTEQHYSATHAAKIIGCSRSSVCRAARVNKVGVFTEGRLAALTKSDMKVIRETVRETSGNPLWIAARGQKIGRKKKRK